MRILRYSFAPVTFVFLAATAFSQDRPIGYWHSHLPYNDAVGIATDGSKTVFVATKQSFYTYDIASSASTTYSKVEGMADVGMAAIGYDEDTRTVILGYKNSNIDLFKDESFFNIPDLKLKIIAGTKNINQVYTNQGIAYLSTDIGIVVIDLDKREIKETYSFTKNGVTLANKQSVILNDSIYTLTSKGFYGANKKSSNLQAFSAWKPIDTTRSLLCLSSYNNKIFVASKDTLFVLNNNTLQYVYRSPDSFIAAIDPGVNGLWVMENNNKEYNAKVTKIDDAYKVSDTFITDGFANKVIEHQDKVTWVSNLFFGLHARSVPNDRDHNTLKPEGPYSPTCWDVYANNKELLVAHGSTDQFLQFQSNPDGFSHKVDDKWTSYRPNDYHVLDGTYDFTDILKGPDGNIYVASNQSGLFILKPDGSYELHQEGVFDTANNTPGRRTYRLGGMDFDQNGNLWITQYYSAHDLILRTKDGNWYKFAVPFASIPHFASCLLVDANNIKWYASPLSGGLVAFTDNNTPGTPSDDQYRQFLGGTGNGYLPDAYVHCLAEDKNGAIWIGTENGIGIMNCPSEVFTSTDCSIEQRIVQYDQFAGYLFQNEVVKTIAVDGANRKWIGTNNGVWLISADGNSIINRFTEDNSPLLSNHIQKITVDPVTGDVYMGTEQGLISYRSTATDGGNTNTNVVSFPNPVPAAYKGTIAIKGVVDGADVRITDISGQLVYRTKALGGQAVWSGNDYTGHRPRSGVYMVFITNKDGSQTHVGKMVFMD